MWSTSSFPSLLRPLYLGVVVPFRVPYMDQIDLLTNYSYLIGPCQKTKKKKIVKYKRHFLTTRHKITLDGLIWFDGILTIVGYSMSNPICTYILDLYDL